MDYLNYEPEPLCFSFLPFVYHHSPFTFLLELLEVDIDSSVLLTHGAYPLDLYLLVFIINEVRQIKAKDIFNKVFHLYGLNLISADYCLTNDSVNVNTHEYRIEVGELPPTYSPF